MIRHIARTSTAVLLALLLILPPRLVFACGPDFTAPTYTSFNWPDDNGAFARGKLGVLQRGYYHLYLFEAYRTLSGKPFSDTELVAIAGQWDGSDTNATNQGSSNELLHDWQKEWRAARAAALGETPKNLQGMFDPFGVSRAAMHDGQYVSYYNCLNAAFENAVHILQDRVKEFGPQSAPVKDWVAAQDQVFENCSGDVGYPPKTKPAVIPAAARPEDPAVVRADRAYQIAAALFYAGDLDAAQRAFQDIAKDLDSPYRKLAPYLVARVLIRKATLQAKEAQFDSQMLRQAEEQLRAILTDKDSVDVHPAAQRLLAFVRIRLHRQERLHELESATATPGAAKSFAQDLTDYLWLLDHPVLTKTVVISPPSEGKPEQRGVTVDESSRLQGGDMTDWILTFHASGDDAYQHSLQRWRDIRSLPWFVSAIAHASANDAALSELFNAASQITPDSPAYLTVTFHRLRLLEQSGLLDTTRRGVDALLAQRSASMPISARNQFRALRMKLATNLSEFLQFAPRFSADASRVAPLPAGKSDYEPGSPEYAATRPHFDSDASVVLTEKLPLRLLAEAAKSDKLPPALRADVAIAAWTRAIELKNDAIAREITPVLSELVPELKSDLAEYSAAQGDARSFAGIFVLLRNPGFRPFVSASPGRGWFYSVGETHFSSIDNFGDNWWCAFRPAQNTQTYGGGFYYMFSKLREPLQEIYPGEVVAEPAFLSAQDKETAQQELNALTALPSAPRWLGQFAIDWANAHPGDPRVPEALHNVVLAWRYGCTESSESAAPKDATNYSKQAFDILHKRYPDNDWTKKTPYWYK
jgi:hypothetical protein